MARPSGGETLIQARLAATPPLEWADGHAFAGFVEAEACFTLVPSNDRRSWRCACAIAQRDDDAAMLTEFQSLTGIGSLSQIRAAGGSAPQVGWTISSRLECERLVEILTAFPLRGRKAFEFSIWSAAVDAWSEATPRRGLSRSMAVRLERAAEQLHFLRRYVDPPRHLPLWIGSEPGLIPYIGGFFTGEGYFQLTRQSAQMAVNLRSDDRPLLELLASETGIGKIYDGPACGTSRPASRWTVLRQDELSAAIGLLERAGLRGRKKREFEAWRSGALEFVIAREHGRRRDHTVVERLAAALLEARRYRSPAAGAIITGRPGPTAREAFVDILRAWAAGYAGPLSVTAYMKERHRNPSWPSRNTVAATFGSWADALEAAGLGQRAAVPRMVREHRELTSQAATRDAKAARRAAQREATLRAVRDLAAELRRPPSLQEFAEWRASRRPGLPAVSTIYSLFPGGWEHVIREADLPET